MISNDSTYLVLIETVLTCKQRIVDFFHNCQKCDSPHLVPSENSVPMSEAMSA